MLTRRPLLYTILVLLGLPSLGSTATLTLTRQSRLVTDAEVASGAPAAALVHEIFITSDSDLLTFANHGFSVPLFQHPQGRDDAPLWPDLVSQSPALGVDSYITMPGSTFMLGNGFGGADQERLWADLSNDGPQSNFKFAQLTSTAPGRFGGDLHVRTEASFAVIPFEVELPGVNDDYAFGSTLAFEYLYEDLPVLEPPAPPPTTPLPPLIPTPPSLPDPGPGESNPPLTPEVPDSDPNGGTGGLVGNDPWSLPEPPELPAEQPPVDEQDPSGSVGTVFPWPIHFPLEIVDAPWINYELQPIHFIDLAGIRDRLVLHAQDLVSLAAEGTVVDVDGVSRPDLANMLVYSTAATYLDAASPPAMALQFRASAADSVIPEPAALSLAAAVACALPWLRRTLPGRVR